MSAPSLGRGSALAALITVLATLAAAPGGAPLGAERAQAFGFDGFRIQVFPLPGPARFGDGLGAGRGHEGQDLFAPAGTPELAVSNAIVLEAGSGYNGGRGNYVSIFSPATNRTYNYFHMLGAPLVAAGERVSTGEKLGELGCSGSCWGDHLHFEVRGGRDPYGPVLDPRPFLERLERTS